MRPDAMGMVPSELLEDRVIRVVSNLKGISFILLPVLHDYLSIIET